MSKIGKKAGVVVNREVRPVSEPILAPKTRLSTGQTKLVEKEVVKYASAHDLRRSFGTRWAKELKPAVLQKLMIHANIGTTTRYYVDLDSDEVAADLWRGFPGQKDTILGTTPTEEPKKSERAPGN